MEKRPQKRIECFGLLFDHLAWIEHQCLCGIRDSRKAGSLWGMMRGVGGVRKSIHQSWLAKGLGLLCWGFKGVQEEILSEEASTLQIGSVVFPAGQCTSPLLHPCHRLFDQDEHQDSSSHPPHERGCDKGHWHAKILLSLWILWSYRIKDITSKYNICDKKKVLFKALKSFKLENVFTVEQRSHIP